MKRVKQIEESKKMIGDALLRLLKEEDFLDISISKITEEAKVSRMTFYRNFESKEEIIKSILQSLQESILNKLQNLPSPSLRNLITIQFTILKEQSAIYILGSQVHTRNMMQRFQEDSMKRFEFLLGDLDVYTIEFYRGGLGTVMSKWIERGMKESPDVMTGKVMKLIDRTDSTDL